MNPAFKSVSAFAAALIIGIGFSGCGSDGSNHSSFSVPQAPVGLGYEQTVAAPNVSYPLPVALYAANNSDGTLKYSINDNPMAYLLAGLNNVWKGTSDAYQAAASGSGPNNYESNPIIDAAVWKENIAYVENVTARRTDDQAILAFLDDRRGKNYSVADGFGPLTEDFVADSGAYVDLVTPTKAQVLENAHYESANNDGFEFGGEENSTLGAMVRLVNDFRNYNASTSGTKYIFSSPRPWRISSTGAVEFLGTDQNYTCTNDDGVTKTYTFDRYTSNVQIVPGLMCARHKHSSSDEGKGLYTATTESKRKDGGYPSGHTNAGVLASLAYAYALPERFSELVTRGSQLGESRIVSGMHSPVDVIGGRIMALAIAASALGQDAISADAATAVAQAKTYFGAKASASGMSLYDYAHKSVSHPTGYTIGDKVNLEVFNNNFYDDHEAIKKLYRFRLTYGLSQNSADAGQPAIVPEGAEALLASRQPYLSAAQRRAVLATTEVDSGYPILDESNGWGRIDLVRAADGYGAFEGDVTVSMDASKGGFNAQDWWRNDISGAGKLTKNGSGTLTLTGSNSYSGGTVVHEGTLEASSANAFGTGDLYMSGGSVKISAATSVKNYTQVGGTLHVSGTLQATDTVTIDGGSLVVTPASNVAVGDTIKVISASKRYGTFDSVSVDGYAVSVKYDSKSVSVKIDKAL